MRTYVDKENKFIEMFDEKTGFYMRSGIVKNGKDTGVDPFMRNFPQLIDIGIMGSCEHGAKGLCIQGGVQCAIRMVLELKDLICPLKILKVL